MKEESDIIKEKETLEKFILNNPDLDKLEGMLSDFNVFETLNMVNAEVRHSNMLAWLFDPKENHGLTEYFIHNFLKAFVANNKSSIKEPTVFDLELFNYTDVEIRREYKNIDLLILIREPEHKLLVAIENKVLSGEHSKQLDRYQEAINDEFSDFNHLLLFLSPDKTLPSNDSWTAIDYNDVINIIDSILSHKKDSITESVAEFISHYNTILKRYFMGNSEVEKICKNIYKKHSDALDLIFQYKPDILTETSEYLQKLVNENSNLKFDSAGKTVVRFTTTAIEKRFPKSSEGWTKFKSIVAYEFYNYYDRMALRLYLGPGNQESRIAIFDKFKENNKLFTHAKGPIYKKHNCIYQMNFLTPKQISEGDFEVLQGAINKKWQHFLEKDMPEIDKYVEENWEEID